MNKLNKKTMEQSKEYYAFIGEVPSWVTDNNVTNFIEYMNGNKSYEQFWNDWVD